MKWEEVVKLLRIETRENEDEIYYHFMAHIPCLDLKCSMRLCKMDFPLQYCSSYKFVAVRRIIKDTSLEKYLSTQIEIE